MPETIISDTSCFIVLNKINALDLLRLVYGTVVTTMQVAAEFMQELPDWVEIKAASDKRLQQILEFQIDTGEASAIALAVETPGSTIILDDYKARRVAERLGLQITGTIGVLIKAKLRGKIPSIKPYLEQIARTDFRLTKEVELQALAQAGEL